MKRTITLLTVFILVLVSIGGCWPWRDKGDPGKEHQEQNKVDYPNGLDQKGPGVPDGGGPGGSGGGH